MVNIRLCIEHIRQMVVLPLQSEQKQDENVA